MVKSRLSGPWSKDHRRCNDDALESLWQVVCYLCTHADKKKPLCDFLYKMFARSTLASFSGIHKGHAWDGQHREKQPLKHVSSQRSHLLKWSAAELSEYCFQCWRLYSKAHTYKNDNVSQIFKISKYNPLPQNLDPVFYNW